MMRITRGMKEVLAVIPGAVVAPLVAGRLWTSAGLLCYETHRHGHVLVFYSPFTFRAF